MIFIKSELDIKLIKEAVIIWRKIRQMLIENTKIGISLNELDQKAYELASINNATCSFYKYRKFPKHICISVNDQLIHGVPNDYKIKDGDLVTFDVGIEYQNHHCDAAFNVIVGHNEKAQHILSVANQALEEGIKKAIPNNHIGDISHAIEQCVHNNGYEVIEDFGGHGCGIKLHEDPLILNYGLTNSGVKLLKNMIICIEPMLLTLSNKYYIDPQNRWTVIAENHLLTCHSEHMVLITENGNEVLTR